MNTNTNERKKPNPPAKRAVEYILFGSKWLLIPFYLGLIVAQVIYCYIDLKEVFHLVNYATSMSEEDVMLMILKLVDMVMIANLIKMIITGSYNSFLSKNHHDDSEKSSSGVLKVKMATSLIGVSSIHLLQTFINAKLVDTSVINKQIIIHVSFLVGAIALALIDYLHVKTDSIHDNNPHNKPNEEK